MTARVLLVIDSAPDYRESFLRLLANSVDLTVFGRRCAEVGLIEPGDRLGYAYRDMMVKNYGPFSFQPQLRNVLDNTWDLVCCDLNLRYPSRVSLLRSAVKRNIPFLWRGRIFGRHDGRFLLGVKKRLLARADGLLVYSQPIADRIGREFRLDAVSYNNTEVSVSEFRVGTFCWESDFRLLFVGRFQERKKLETLVAAVKRHKWLSVRLIGPGMEAIRAQLTPEIENRVSLYGYTVGEKLNEHFDWAHMVVNPGDVGLLVMNAARHGKGIVVGISNTHGPESYLAEQAEQPFIDFSSEAAIDSFLNDLRNDRERVQRYGIRLQEIAKREYTIEYMAQKHVDAFEKTLTRRSNLLSTASG